MPSKKTVHALYKTAIALVLMLIFAVVLALYQVQPASAGGGVARALEQLEGMREGTRRANRLMGVNTRRVPWCGHAVAYAVRAAGKKPVKGYPSAAAWQRYGRRVSKRRIRRGDVIVFRSKYSKSGRHVAVATRVKGRKVKVCGGNTRNRVYCNWRPISRIVTVRR